MKRHHTSSEKLQYRRDRRKDQLLQENGYLALRYLAEDLAKELDSVLDSDHRRAREPRVSCVRPLTGALASAGGQGTPR